MGKTWKPKVAGVLAIVVGTFRCFVGLLLITVYMSCPPSPGFPMSGGLLAWLAATCYMVIGILAIVGGIYALGRRKWGRAFIGSICAAFSVLVIPLVVHNLNWTIYGSIFAPPDILGILAVVLTVLSKGEFE